MTVTSLRVLQELENDSATHLGHVSAAHGFLPSRAPDLALPPSHRAWDDAAAELPAMWRDLSARPLLRELPLLSAAPEDLPDDALWRASVVLSALAYSYARCDVDDLHAPAPLPLPECLERPWRQVAERMGRPGPHVAYDDLVTCNYRLVDPAAPEPVRLENLHLLVPMLGNETERAFLGVNIEIQARLAPVVAASVRAQEAVSTGDREALVESLLVILDSVRQATDVAFPKVDPNPHAAIHADPAVWAKLTAPTGIAITAGAPGVSGAGSTGFQLVDTFLGRTRFDSSLAGESRKVRSWFAPHCRRFLDAIEEVSVRRHIADSGDRELAGLFQSVLEAYAGDRGYLGVHRRKVYGFIQAAFKVGRPATASGITGTLRDRTWRETDNHLHEARDERYAEFFSNAQVGRLARRQDAGRAAQRVTLDVRDTGVVFRPGDRCAVLPENTEELVDRTLAALRAEGARTVPIPTRWRDALHRRTGRTPPAVLPLEQLLRYAHLRPLDRRVAKALVRLSGSAALTRVLEDRSEDRIELWDALEMMAEQGYDVTRLWRAELWQEEALARIVPPAAPRMYSVTLPPDTAPFPEQLVLTVGRLRYLAGAPSGEDVPRHGAGSTFLVSAAQPGAPVNLQVVRPLRFALPADASRPVVMFAGGTGVSPFRGFAAERAADPDAGPTWLFAGARSRADLPYYDDLAALAAAGRLQLRTAFSREEVDGVAPRRIDEAITEPATAEQLRALLLRAGEEDGPLFYVCGQAAFASSVLDALRGIAGDGDEEQGRVALRRLVGHGGLMNDLFTTFAPKAGPGVAGAGLHDASDLVLHNDEQHGWWMAIGGNVYDVTEFRQLHPGGFRIIDDNAGLDASSEYEAVLHHQDSEIEAMLAMYKIGQLRRLDLGRVWGMALHGSRVRYLPLIDLFKSWLTQLYLVVELENSLRNDWGFLSSALTDREDPDELTPLKLMLAADLQSRVLSVYLPDLVGSGLHDLWASSCGMFDPDADAGLLPRQLRDLAAGPGARAVAAAERLRDAVRSHRLDPSSTGPLLQDLRAADGALVAGVKLRLREGLLAFETHEAEVLAHGADQVFGGLRAVPGIVEEFYVRVAAAVESLLPAPHLSGGIPHGRTAPVLRPA